MNSLEHRLYFSDNSPSTYSRRKFLQLVGATIAVGPLLIPHPAEQAIRRITPVPGDHIDFRKYFEGFHKVTPEDSIYTELYSPMQHEKQEFVQTKPDTKHPYGTIVFDAENDDTQYELKLSSNPTKGVSLHPLHIQVYDEEDNEQEEKYILSLVQSVRPSEQKMSLRLNKGKHKITLTSLSDNLDLDALRPPALSIPHGTPLQEMIRRQIPIYNQRPDLIHHPQKDAMLLGFTVVYVNENGEYAIENRIIAASEESLMSAAEREKQFEGRTVDIETNDVKKAAYSLKNGWSILSGTKIIQVRGHEWRPCPDESDIDQITETDNVAGLKRLTNYGLSPSFLILPAGWQNIDLVRANPELQILGFRQEAGKRTGIFQSRLPHAEQDADRLLTDLRQNPEGVYPSLIAA